MTAPTASNSSTVKSCTVHICGKRCRNDNLTCFMFIEYCLCSCFEFAENKRQRLKLYIFVCIVYRFTCRVTDGSPGRHWANIKRGDVHNHRPPPPPMLTSVLTIWRRIGGFVLSGNGIADGKMVMAMRSYANASDNAGNRPTNAMLPVLKTYTRKFAVILFLYLLCAYFSFLQILFQHINVGCTHKTLLYGNICKREMIFCV